LKKLTGKQLVTYFDTIKLAQKAIGVRKENRKHLLRLERLKKLLFDAYEGCTSPEFIKESSVEELESLLENNRDLKVAWDRDNGTLCKVPGRPKVRFEYFKAYDLSRRKKTEAPVLESLNGLPDKSSQQTG
jgi:hypothetical protein